MRDRTSGNTMAKVWRQALESHSEEYLQRKDLYTTLLSQYKKPGKITRKSKFEFLSILAKTNKHEFRFPSDISTAEALAVMGTKLPSIYRFFTTNDEVGVCFLCFQGIYVNNSSGHQPGESCHVQSY